WCSRAGYGLQLHALEHMVGILCRPLKDRRTSKDTKYQKGSYPQGLPEWAFLSSVVKRLLSQQPIIPGAGSLRGQPSTTFVTPNQEENVFSRASMKSISSQLQKRPTRVSSHTGGSVHVLQHGIREASPFTVQAHKRAHLT